MSMSLFTLLPINIKNGSFEPFFSSLGVKKVGFVLTRRHGPLRTAAPTGSFLAAIYVIMVKNTITRRLFPQKKRRNRTEARSLIVEKNPAKRFFDSLARTTPVSEWFLLQVGDSA